MTAMPQHWTRRDLWIHLLLYPGHTLPTAAAPIFVGVGLAIHAHVFAPVAVVLGFLASWLVHVAGVFTDNYELLFSHPEVLEHPELTDAVASGALTRRDLAAAILGSLGLAVVIGFVLLPAAGLPVVVLGLIGIVASLGYAAGPLPSARFGFAEPLFLVMFAIVAEVAILWLQAAVQPGATWQTALGSIPAGAWIYGWPVGALVTNVLIIDDIRDRDFDAAKGWRTNTVRFGGRWSRALFVVLAILTYLAPIAFWLLLGVKAWILLPLLTLPMGWRIARTVWTETRRERLVPMTPRASFLALLFSVLLGIGVALS